MVDYCFKSCFLCGALIRPVNGVWLVLDEPVIEKSLQDVKKNDRVLVIRVSAKMPSVFTPSVHRLNNSCTFFLCGKPASGMRSDMCDASGNHTQRREVFQASAV